MIATAQAALVLTEVGGIALSAGSVVSFTYALGANPESLPLRQYRTYVAYLERKLRNMFVPTSGHVIAGGQAAGLALVAGGAIALDLPGWYAMMAVIVVGPALAIERMRRERVRSIETKLDGFMLAFANALKSTPSIGNALAFVQPLTPAPLDREIELVLKEMRLGNTVDQALLSMSARVRSFSLDAALAGVLIGRQVGGNLAQILDVTADTLREMNRLQGVIRTKTAESRAQLVVLALFPAVLLFGFDAISPGYFQPLTASIAGIVATVVAATCWVASIVVARRLMAVDI
jgi:tight adherence protein B